MPVKPFYTAMDIANALGIHHSLFWYRQKKGIYPRPRKQGHFWVFTEAEVEAILRRRAVDE